MKIQAITSASPKLDRYLAIKLIGANADQAKAKKAREFARKHWGELSETAKSLYCHILGSPVKAGGQKTARHLQDAINRAEDQHSGF